MSKKSRSAIADYAVYLVLRFVVCVVQALSWRGAQAFAGFLAWFAHRVDRRHRKVAADNLRIAFPGRYSDEEIDHLVRAIYLHFCTLLVDIILTPRKLHVGNWKRHIEISGDEKFIGLVLSGRPVLLVTGHFGNWEIAGYVIGLLGFTTYAVARRLDNPYLDDFLRRFREHTGQRVLEKNEDYGRIMEVIADGGVLATLADQSAGERGLFVDFFGRPASTHKAIALMALEHNVPILVSGTPRVGEPLRYRIIVEDVILPEEYARHSDPVRAITERFTAALENVVRRQPEQYFWLHNRWKHQPRARKVRARAG